MKEQREQESKVLFIFFEYSVMCGTELTQENRPFWKFNSKQKVLKFGGIWRYHNKNTQENVISIEPKVIKHPKMHMIIQRYLTKPLIW